MTESRWRLCLLMLGASACTEALDVDPYLVPCGDRTRAGAEECDDGNQVSGDGCSAACRLEPGFQCETSSTAPAGCRPLCGDGLIVATESCDDGNLASGDGCTESCRVESGFGCEDQPSDCRPICGDGEIRGSEGCDDGATSDGDGCSATCRQELGFLCVGSGMNSCESICGDGLIVGMEACDDEDLEAGDGCDGACTIELGYTCSGSPSNCTTSCGDGLVAGNEACDDANPVGGDGCSELCRVEEGFSCVNDPFAPSDCQPHWEVRPAGVAIPEGSESVWTGTALLFYGGGTPGVAALDTVASYEPFSDVWSTPTGVGGPGPRVGHVAVWLSGSMAVFGGYDPNDVLASGAIYEPNSGVWTPMSPEPGGGRAEGRAVWTGAEMIVVGGLGPSGEPRPGGDRYDPALDVWVPTSSLAEGRRGHVAVWTGSRVFVHGGRIGVGDASSLVDRPMLYDPEADQWRLAAPSPLAPRSEHAAVLAEGRVAIFGGRGADGVPFGDGALYDPEDDTWVLMPDLGAPSARADASMAFGDAQVFVLGGAEDGALGARLFLDAMTWAPVTNMNGPISARRPAIRYLVERLVWAAGDEVGFYRPPPP